MNYDLFSFGIFDKLISAFGDFKVKMMEKKLLNYCWSIILICASNLLCNLIIV